MSRRDESGPLGHRQHDPRFRGGDWHPPRDPAPDAGSQIRGRPWRGVRYNTDTPKETR